MITKNLIGLVLLLSCGLVNAQVKDYFLPKPDYFNETFSYESEIWENNDGQFQVKNEIQYFRDRSGNYKKYAESNYYRYNVNTMTLKAHMFFNISNEKVTQIAFYLEGISESLKASGFIDDINMNDIILKTAPSTWTIDKDDAVEYYKSENGNLSTKYAKYDDCIIVTQTTKAKTKGAKWSENFKTKSYYAKGLGLVKTETYENGKLAKAEVGYGGTLVDNFSEYSFYKQRIKEEQARINALNKKKLDDFLKSRDTLTVSSSNYNSFKSGIKKQIESELKNIKTNTSVQIKAIYYTDYNGNPKNSVTITGNISAQNSARLKNELEKLKLTNEIMFDNYPVNTKADYNINCSTQYGECILKSNDFGVNIEGDRNSQIIADFNNKNYPMGKYKANYSTVTIDNQDDLKISYVQTKGLGGSSAALLSVPFPGLGNYLVNGGKGSIFGKNASPLITTFLTYGLIGTGVYLNIESSNNYKSYHNATEQTEIDAFYDKANNQNKLSYIAFGTGAVLWIWDIAWTAKKGSENKRNNQRFKGEISLNPCLYQDGTGLCLTYKF